MSPWWKISLLLAAIAVNLGIGWHLHSIYDNAKMAKQYKDQIEAAQKAQQEANDHAADLEKQLAAERQNSQTLTAKLEQNLAKHPAYSACKLSADSVQLLNSSIAGHSSR